MKDFQERMIKEYDELNQKLTNLHKFIGSDTWMSLKTNEQNLLQQQEAAMGLYLFVLNERISMFSDADET